MYPDHDHDDTLEAFVEMCEPIPADFKMEPESRALFDTLRNSIEIESDGKISIRLWGFKVVLRQDGTYYLHDTSGG